MKPSSLRIWAVPVLILEAGILTFFLWMRLALRRRVNMSLIGSVIMIGRVSLPGRLAHAGDLAAVCGVAQADPTDAELAVHRGLAAAHRAARVGPRGELGLALLLDDPSGLGHGGSALPFLPRALRGRGFLGHEGHAELLEEPVALLVGRRRGHERDVHALRGLELVEVDLREDALLGEAERVVPPAVELVAHAAEVADTREDDREQAVGELPHAVAAQRHRAADRHALAQLEARDRLLRLADD